MGKDYDIQIYNSEIEQIWVRTKSSMGLEGWEGEGHQNKEISYWEAGALNGSSERTEKLATMITWGKDENHDPGVKVSIDAEAWIEGREREALNKKKFLLIVQEY